MANPTARTELASKESIGPLTIRPVRDHQNHLLTICTSCFEASSKIFLEAPSWVLTWAYVKPSLDLLGAWVAFRRLA